MTLLDEAAASFGEFGAESWVAEVDAHRVEADLFAGRWDDVLRARSAEDPRRPQNAGQDAALNSKLLRFRGVALAAHDQPHAENGVGARRSDRRTGTRAVRARTRPTRIVGASRASDCRDSIAQRRVELLQGLGISNPAVLVPAVPYGRSAPTEIPEILA